jgi:hypothetical protein
MAATIRLGRRALVLAGKPSSACSGRRRHPIVRPAATAPTRVIQISRLKNWLAVPYSPAIRIDEDDARLSGAIGQQRRITLTGVCPSRQLYRGLSSESDPKPG